MLYAELRGAGDMQYNQTNIYAIVYVLLNRVELGCNVRHHVSDVSGSVCVCVCAVPPFGE